MSRGVLILIVVVVAGALYAMSVQRTAVGKDESVIEKWANVEAAYQRRADLIPNLQSIVKGAADFESSTLNDVIEARSKATQVNIDASKLTEESMAQFQVAQGEFSSALSRLLVTVERYPELKATQAFRDFQSQLEGTENRINKSRTDFNESVRGYNSYVRAFPASFFAGIFGFDRRPSFKADPGSENAPDVSFDFNS